MRIVFCTQNMAPFRMKWMDEIAKNHNVMIYQLDEYEKGVNSKYISYYPNKATVKNATKLLLNRKKVFNTKEIINENADVYILDGYGFLGQQLLILKLKRKNIPFILSIDGGFIREKECFLKKFIKRFFISKATAYFSTSEETDKYINYYGGNGKVKYRHLFSNVSDEYLCEKPISIIEKEKIKKELKMKDAFSVISVGKFEYRKGFDLLLKAAENINENIHIYLIGADNKEEYEKYISELNRKKVHFVEFCNQDKLKKYYLACDLFLLPTREDIWGLVISEAMANGIPVVTTNRCLAGVAMLEKRDIISVDNVNDIERIINKYYSMSGEERLKIGEENIKKVLPYTIQNSVKKDLNSLNRFINERKSRCGERKSYYNSSSL